MLTILSLLQPIITRENEEERTMHFAPQSFAEVKQYVSNHMSLLLEADGHSPLVGRILALLLFATEPVSLQEIAEQLKVTRAAVSVHIRSMERNALCHKVATSNDRKNYYYISDDVDLSAIRAFKDRITATRSMVDTALTACDMLPDVHPEEMEAHDLLKRRFCEFAALSDLLMSQLEELEEKWKVMKQQLGER
ncbi:GbsR/MarR family transcriptional regulator [Paenibacillus konkukensis]|nr:HTH domain-containing protein [Paenibacillus konkukensis]